MPSFVGRWASAGNEGFNADPEGTFWGLILARKLGSQVFSRRSNAEGQTMTVEEFSAVAEYHAFEASDAQVLYAKIREVSNASGEIDLSGLQGHAIKFVFAASPVAGEMTKSGKGGTADLEAAFWAAVLRQVLVQEFYFAAGAEEGQPVTVTNFEQAIENFQSIGIVGWADVRASFDVIDSDGDDEIEISELGSYFDRARESLF